MTDPSNPSLAPVLLVLVALGGAGAAAARPTTVAGPQDDFRPIRFGDVDEHVYDAQFFPGASYDPSVTRPEALLGAPVGSRLARHDEVLAAFRTWAEESPRVTLATYARTYEGRDLVRAVITTPANHARLDAIKNATARLSDPRGLDDTEAERLVSETPAVAWMGYSIHGDETSGTDASLAVGYHLIAAVGDDVRALLDDVVVVLDPCLNPDGRTRILSMVEQNAGYRANLDGDSMHRGRWPYGRGNHYLFDVNRDWMAGVCPETRGRWAVALEFHPQLFVDAHEMGGDDTFLLYPQARPHHPALPEKLLEWQAAFAADHARAFDRMGWGYYTREWADAWYPGYTDAWGSLNGAIGLLYEQARFGGQPYLRPSGEVVSYREAVHHQAVASLANLSTLRERREAVLADYLAHRRVGVDASRVGGERAFLFAPSNPSRTRRLVAALLAQGIEVERARESFVASSVVDAMGGKEEQRTFPAGTLVVSATQPQAALVHAYLELDPRIDQETAVEEREALERDEGSKLYDVTAWDLARQFDLEAAWGTPEGGGREPLELGALDFATPSGAGLGGRVLGDADPPFAWIVDGTDDRSVPFAARAMELGLAVHLADEDFEASVVRGSERAAVEFPRGSLLLRRHENPEGVAGLVARVAEEVGLDAFVTSTGRAPGEGADLGGGHFHLLERPRVALLGGPPVSSSDYGHAWRELDEELRVPTSLLDAQAFGSSDLRRYNVLVVPPAFDLAGALGPHAETLATWVRGGGTLVALGGSAAALAGDPFALGSVVRRRDALEKLEEYEFLARRAEAAREVHVDYESLWEDAVPRGDAPPEAEVDATVPESGEDEASKDEEGLDPDLERRDAWMRRFSPAGVILRGLVDLESWITVGARSELPVPFGGSTVLLSGGATPVRLAPRASLRLGGLLWSEARERIADSAWLTVDRVGDGQVILFAASPVFRGSWRGTARLFANAVVYGPGAGANPPPTR